MTSSRFPGFYRHTPMERRKAIAEEIHFDSPELFDASSLSLQHADIMVENVIGTFAMPLAIAVNFSINGSDRLIPMVVEEPSVIAAVSNMAKLVRPHGGFQSHSDESIMIGQVQLYDVSDPVACIEKLNHSKEFFMEQAHQIHPRLIERGGGIRGLDFRHIRYDEEGETPSDMVVMHFYLDCVDAMGANMINTIAEMLAPRLQDITGEKVGLRILSNYATKRLATARCQIPVNALNVDGISGELVAKGIINAYRFAYADPWRAATNNKGIMNGIDALAIATGNDWRAIEAGAHAWAARSGQYRSLGKWSLKDDSLVGELTLPMQVGTVGGPIRTHPQVAANLKILGNPRAKELSGIMAVIGLAQNLGALRALATEGIQKGHMRMHSRNIAIQAGAKHSEIPLVVERMSETHSFSLEFAQQILQSIRSP
ncbi:MAG: hydroxymethylglutaryl-CoA reductase, degradative [Myxococcota bacterium]|nr:hydroxymethylglutaryl-CoA reductase, degradative [Myxococcota bacterium]